MLERTDEFALLVLEFGGKHPPTAKKRKPGLGFSQLAVEVSDALGKVRHLLEQVSRPYLDFSAQGMSDEERDSIEGVLAEALLKAESSLASKPLAASVGGVNSQDHERGATYLLLDQIRTLQEQCNLLQTARRENLAAKSEKLCPVVSMDGPEQWLPQTTQASRDLFEFSEEEMAELEFENQALEERLNTELEEAHKIERTANEVSELIQMFSTKVLDQHHVIGNLYDDSLYAADTIREVPKELHKTGEHSKGYRQYMLSFFLIMGLLLLLLDWVNS
ncbi:hypothetical protein BASA81_002664 [Batrachochytrium salamandrivorans]|nr:hypothetical protein BASA81_002664 [Batrachochytrium salamandrivorans]